MNRIEPSGQWAAPVWRWIGYAAATAAIFSLTAWLTAIVAPAALAVSNETVWYAIRASGIVSYLFLAASTIWGLLLTSKAVKDAVPAAVALDLHNYLSWIAIGITVLHAALLLFSDFFAYNLVNLLIPFTGPFQPFWVGLGIIGLYLMGITSVTFYAIRRTGIMTFRRIHYLTYVAFGLVLLHSIVTGTDTQAMAAIYWLTGLSVAFLTLFRLIATRAVPASR